MIIIAIALAILEILVTVSVAKYLGIQQTCLLYLATSGTGIIIWKLNRKQFSKQMDEIAGMQRELKKHHGDGASQIAMENPDFRNAMGDMTNYSLIIFLLLIPGLLTTVVGYLLFLPFVRRNFNPIYGHSPRSSKELSRRSKKFK